MLDHSDAYIFTRRIDRLGDSVRTGTFGTARGSCGDEVVDIVMFAELKESTLRMKICNRCIEQRGKVRDGQADLLYGCRYVTLGENSMRWGN